MTSRVEVRAERFRITTAWLSLSSQLVASSSSMIRGLPITDRAIVTR